MTEQEVKQVIDGLKAEGYSEKEILGSFYKLFQNEELTLDQFDGLVNFMGYHLTDDFKNMSPEDQKTKGFEKTGKPAEGVDAEEVKDAKEVDDGEKDDEPEYGRKVDNDNDKKSEDEDEDEDESESDEEKRAMKLFGLDK